MRKILLVLSISAAVAVLDSRPGLAYPEGPWCAVFSLGNSVAAERCSFTNFEACRMEIVAGNRGFCRQNSRWPGYYTTYGEAKPRKARKRARR